MKPNPAAAGPAVAGPPPPPVVIICPGNGCVSVRNSNWYGRLHRELTDRNVPCVLEDFPDPHRARRDRWVPHIRSLAQVDNRSSSSSEGDGDDADDNVVLVGHSSGAQAALRYAEEHRLKACVLVAATYSDLGDANERASGYYPRRPIQGNNDGEEEEESNPYDFAAMTANCPVWRQLHSDDDPFIPVSEAERIRDGLGLVGAAADDDDVDDDGGGSGTYHLLPGRSHFFEFQPELLDVVLSVL